MEDDMAPLKQWFKTRSQERRKAERRDTTELVAHYWDGASPAAHIIRNISAGGLYILTEQRWYPGTLVMLTLQRKDSIGDEAERSITVQSKVIRSGPDGVGLAFVPVEHDEKRTASGSSGDPGCFLTAGRKALTRFLQSIQ
jgi:hypothetical protein